jgi:hypothetical protein
LQRVADLGDAAKEELVGQLTAAIKNGRRRFAFCAGGL